MKHLVEFAASLFVCWGIAHFWGLSESAAILGVIVGYAVCAAQKE
jgi:hypothetical protein